MKCVMVFICLAQGVILVGDMTLLEQMCRGKSISAVSIDVYLFVLG